MQHEMLKDLQTLKQYRIKISYCVAQLAKQICGHAVCTSRESEAALLHEEKLEIAQVSSLWDNQKVLGGSIFWELASVGQV